jgi:hypothetical protein
MTIKSRSFLNIDVMNPISDMLPFTYDTLEKSTFQTVDFMEQFSTVLVRMPSEQLTAAAVMSDGCSFQRKAMCWRNPNSPQFQFPDFAKILFVPCICYHAQNAMILHMVPYLFEFGPVVRSNILSRTQVDIVVHCAEGVPYRKLCSDYRLCNQETFS